MRREFGDAVDFVLDGGEAEGGVASTIVDMTQGEVRMLREGAVSRGEIEAGLASKGSR